MSESSFSYTTQPGPKEGTLIVRLNGPLTLTTMFGFQGDFRAMKPNVLILDLSETPYVDSAGLGLIVNQHVSATSAGKSFLIAGANFRVDALMEMTKVKQILKTFPTVEAAEASL